MPINPPQIPVWQLYGEKVPFPDLLHVERISDRAAGLEWKIALHRHLLLHQIFFFVSGEIAMTIDGAVQEIAPPSVLNIPRGRVHGFRFSAGTEGYVLTLPAEIFPELFGAGSETEEAAARAFVAAATDDMPRLFAEIAKTQASAMPWRRTLLKALAAQLLVRVLQQAPGGSMARHRNVDARIARFETLVQDHLKDRWSVDRYAQVLAVSPRHLSRLCHDATGLPAGAYIEAHVVREACRLLVYTRMTVQAVGFHLGFEDPSYFSRVFHRGMAVSPKAYRARFDR